MFATAAITGSGVRSAKDDDKQPGNNGNEFSQISTRRKTLIARTKAQDNYIRALNAKTMIFAAGPAGTGKTYLAVASAVQAPP